jgi:hypothetical protein
LTLEEFFKSLAEDLFIPWTLNNCSIDHYLISLSGWNQGAERRVLTFYNIGTEEAARQALYTGW